MPGPTSASWKMTSASRISRSALRVSSSGSPGPAPTSQTSPGAMMLSDGIADLLGRFQQSGDGGAARSAVGACLQRDSHLLQCGQRFRCDRGHDGFHAHVRSEEHTSELQSLMRIPYDVFCLKKN